MENYLTFQSKLLFLEIEFAILVSNKSGKCLEYLYLSSFWPLESDLLLVHYLLYMYAPETSISTVLCSRKLCEWDKV